MRRVEAGRARNFATRMPACAAEIESGNRRARAGPIGQGPLAKELPGHHVEVADIATGQPHARFHVGRRMQRPIENDVGQIGRVLGQLTDEAFAGRLAIGIPVRRRFARGRVKSPDREDVMTGRRDARIVRRGHLDFHDELLRNSSGLGIEPGLAEELRRLADFDFGELMRMKRRPAIGEILGKVRHPSEGGVELEVSGFGL